MVKNPPANARNLQEMQVRSLGCEDPLGGGGNDNLLQYSCQENPVDRRAQWATLHGDAKGWTQLKRLSSSIALKCENIKSKEKIQGSYFTNCPQMKHSH